MAVDSTALIVPGHGTIFKAPANTKMPAAGLSAFSLRGTVPDGWSNLGHTSADDTVTFNLDGGDATVLNTWLEDGVRTVYAATSWSLTVDLLQIDEDGLDLTFNGAFDTDDGYIIPGSNAGVDAALFVLCQDATAQLGFYIPSTSVKLGDAPSVDTANFFELPISASIQSASTDVIPPLSDGRSGIMKLYRTGLSGSGS